MVSIRFFAFFALAASVIAIPLDDETKVSSSAALSKLALPPNEKAVTCKVTGSDGCVNIRSGPGTSYSSVGCINPGTSVSFSCYKIGTTVGGISSWDKMSGSPYGYMSEYYLSSACRTGVTTPC